MIWSTMKYLNAMLDQANISLLDVNINMNIQVKMCNVHCNNNVNIQMISILVSQRLEAALNFVRH